MGCSNQHSNELHQVLIYIFQQHLRGKYLVQAEVGKNIQQ